MSKDNMSWKDIQKFVSELSLEEQVTVARLKGVEVPSEILAEVEAKKALGDITLAYGVQRSNDPTKAFVTFKTGSPLGDTTAKGTARTGKAPYMEIRTLDAEIARLTVARDALRQAGFPTSPTSWDKVPGMSAGRAAGFSVKNNLPE